MNEIEYLLRIAEDNSYHIGILNEEYGMIAERMAVMETKVGTIEQLGWIIIGAIIASAVGYYFSHQAIKREIKNGKK